jgi:hypothetical protein
LSRPSTPYFDYTPKDVDARHTRAFTPVFDGLWPGMTTFTLLLRLNRPHFLHVRYEVPQQVLDAVLECRG